MFKLLLIPTSPHTIKVPELQSVLPTRLLLFPDIYNQTHNHNGHSTTHPQQYRRSPANIWW